jgi:hypothetical protein
VAEYTDAQILDSLLLMRNLQRMSCPFCKTITANPLGSQIEFAHRFSPETLHRCYTRLSSYAGMM